jgi:hypothetical protein
MTINLDELERLAKAATPGPWCDRGFGSIQPESGGSLVAVTVTKGGCLPDYVENSALIAAANPTAILELVAEVRALREERTGPGTPSARLCFLLNGLNDRFPDAVDKYSSEPAEPKLLEAVDVLIEDAQRYRWLRDGEEDVFCMFGSNGSWGECGHIEIYGDRLDEHIDAVLAGDALGLCGPFASPITATIRLLDLIWPKPLPLRMKRGWSGSLIGRNHDHPPRPRFLRPRRYLNGPVHGPDDGMALRAQAKAAYPPPPQTQGCGRTQGVAGGD